MKSIQTKILILILSCVFLAAILMGGGGVMYLRQNLSQNSDQVLNLLCEEKAQDLNEQLRDVEQSVSLISDYAMGQLYNEVPQWKEGTFTQYVNNVRNVASHAAENTDSAIAVYYRFNPELVTSLSGFFLSRSDEAKPFTSHPATDLSAYDKDDVERVGWYYIPIEQGKPTWMGPYYNRNLGVTMISYVIPIYQSGVTIGVIGMDLDAQKFYDNIKAISVYDTGYAFLMDEENGVLSHPDYPEQDVPEEVELALSSVKAQINQNQNQQNQVIVYHWNGAEKRMTWRHLLNGMTLAIAVPESEVRAPERAMIMRYMLYLDIALLVSVLLTIRFSHMIVRPLQQLTEAAKKIARGNLEVSIQCKTHDEVGVLAESINETAKQLNQYIDYINRLAYTDVLTNVRNKASYEERVSELDKMIKNGSAEFAVVVLDINNLKHMNDHYGHEMGDRLIVESVGIMRNVFGEEALFRIGGDEFAVILTMTSLLQQEDLIRAFDQEIARFNRNNEEMHGDIQIARGVAVYEKADKTFAEVFRRADARMYEHKAWLKKQAADEM